MTKTFLNFIGLSALLTTTAIAASSMVAPSALQGMTIGLQGGYATGDSENKFTELLTGRTPANKTDLSGRGIIGGLNLTYRNFFNQTFYAGIQLNASFAGLQGQSNNNSNPLTNNVRTHLKMNDSFGAALRLGSKIGGILPYIKVGAVTSNFKAGLTADSVLGKGHTNKRSTGFECGIGMDAAISDKVSIGGEFTHTEYQNIKYTVSTAAGTPSASNTITPKINAFMIRVNYKIM